MLGKRSVHRLLCGNNKVEPWVLSPSAHHGAGRWGRWTVPPGEAKSTGCAQLRAQPKGFTLPGWHSTRAWLPCKNATLHLKDLSFWEILQSDRTAQT